MSKAVVLARTIQTEWLDAMVEVYLATKEHEEVKEKINGYLAGFITSPTVLRKTREILMRTWVDVDESLLAARDWGLKIWSSCPRDERIAVHWGMLLLVFPIFRDLCATIGKLDDIQEEITLSQIKRRIYELWGERTTLVHSLPKNMQTLRYFEAVAMLKPGYYKTTKRVLHSSEVISFLLFAAMQAGGKLYYNLTEIAKFKELFPFEYAVRVEDLQNSGVFKVDRFGGEAVVSI